MKDKAISHSSESALETYFEDLLGKNASVSELQNLPYSPQVSVSQCEELSNTTALKELPYQDTPPAGIEGLLDQVPAQTLGLSRNVEIESLLQSDIHHDRALKEQSEICVTENEPEKLDDFCWDNPQPTEAFQVLFFEAFGMVYAVPLQALGGIHRIGSCNKIPGKPSWYLGLQHQAEQKFDVVDTVGWVMSDKMPVAHTQENYSYIVILGDSRWALACDSLVGTESFTAEQIKWRTQAGKRPWLAGLVKEKMCALIHVEALISMLDQGIDASIYSSI